MDKKQRLRPLSHICCSVRAATIPIINHDLPEPVMTTASPTFNRFSDFYPYYLEEHANRTCRRLHFVGTTLVILTAVYALVSGHLAALLLLPLLGYGFAWVGHFYFEHNKPATFKYPFYSLAGDFVMYKDIVTGKIAF